MIIRPMTTNDWPQVAQIYADGIAGRNATFETQVPDWSVWDATHLQVGRLVAVVDRVVKGWVALSAVSTRDVYRGVAEDTIYIANGAQGQGIGSALMTAMIDDAEAAGIWSLLAVTLRENDASIALHKKFGFRIVGYRERIAQLDGIWRDTIMMERRSRIIGND